MKAPLIGFTIGVTLSALLGFTTAREMASTNPDFASYGCVEATNCHR